MEAHKHGTSAGAELIAPRDDTEVAANITALLVNAAWLALLQGPEAEPLQ